MVEKAILHELESDTLQKVGTPRSQGLNGLETI